MPDYIQFDGVPADIPRANGGMPGFLAYPESPVKVHSDAPASNPITALTYTYSTVAPDAGSNVWLQQLNERLGAPLEITYLAAREYPSKFATMTAGGDLPDIVTDRAKMSTWPEAVARWRADGGDKIRAEYEDSYATIHG